jgi:predicted AlkP superfamily phosphohydrolase/phosphomutase
MAGTPTILIGLDGAEPSALASDTSSGRFPTLAGLAERGAHGRLVGEHGYLTDTVWPEIRTGVSGITTGIYYAPMQFRGGERRARPLTAAELTPDRFYWNVAADAGLRVAAVDQPLAPVRTAGAEFEIGGWGTHDRPFGLAYNRPEAASMVDRVGPHPIGQCNWLNDGTPVGRRRLFDLIGEGIERRVRLLEEVLALEPWDLFTAVFGEPHCLGHHFWPPGEGVAGELESAEPGTRVVDHLYQLLDAAVGRLLGQVPASARVIVYASHGMAPTDEGVFLVGDVLERLGLLPARRRRRRVAAAVPPRLRGLIRRVVGGAALQQAGLTLDRGLGGAARAVPLLNSRHGAIRLAMAGRDPGASLTVGSAEYRDLVAELRAAFGELTFRGERIVDEVVLVDEVFGPQRHPDLPDVLIRFRGDLGMITECSSPRLGTIGLIRQSHRTGEHGTPGAIWATGPGIVPGRSLGDVRTIDLAPTVLAGCGLPIPQWVEGEPVPGLC